MKKLLLALSFLPVAAMAQNKGIRFSHAASWEEVVQQARAEKKMIFVDAFTTWCGPCKYLSSQVFTQDAVGKFFNDKFISVKVQLDTTANDDEHVRQWYPTASRMMRSLKVQVFPTLLFFDQDGNPVHRFSGASDGPNLIEYAAKALDPEQQFYSLKKRYEKGDHDVKLLRNFSEAALMAYQPEVASKAFAEYMQQTDSKLTKDNAQLVYYMANTSADLATTLLAADPKGFDAVYGKAGAADERVRGILFSELLDHLMTKGKSSPYIELVASLKSKYPKQLPEAEARANVYFLKENKDVQKLIPAAVDYMKKFGATATASDKNELAWAVFENVPADKALLNQALAWSKASLAANDPNHYDTYANLLHKLGRTPEAIPMETKAISLAKDDDSKAAYKANLEKMKKGQKTW